MTTGCGVWELEHKSSTKKLQIFSELEKFAFANSLTLASVRNKVPRQISIKIMNQDGEFKIDYMH